MTTPFPQIWLVRHGETEWSRSGKHTGRSDIPLTANGEEAARALSGRLANRTFSAVWTSPSARAQTTCALAGFAKGSVVKPDLAEWDYGAYEGVTTKKIQEQRPGWFLFRDGCPLGETAADVGARADRVINALHEETASVLIFSSAHFLRVLCARWIDLPPERGASFVLDTASVSILGYEHGLDEPVVRGWNQCEDVSAY